MLFGTIWSFRGLNQPGGLGSRWSKWFKTKETFGFRVVELFRERLSTTFRVQLFSFNFLRLAVGEPKKINRS